MPNVMAALPNVGGAVCSRWQTLAGAHYSSKCSNAAKTRNPLKFAGYPKLSNRSQRIVGRNLPYCEHMWERHCCLSSCFPIIDTCLSCEDIVRQSCAMVPRWPVFGVFWVLHFRRAACSTFQTCILNLH